MKEKTSEYLFSHGGQNDSYRHSFIYTSNVRYFIKNPFYRLVNNASDNAICTIIVRQDSSAPYSYSGVHAFNLHMCPMSSSRKKKYQPLLTLQMNIV